MVSVLIRSVKSRDKQPSKGNSAGPVRNYMVQIRQKRGVSSLVNLAQSTVEHGLAPPDTAPDRADK